MSVPVSGTGRTNDVANINFGIDQRPSSASATVTLATQPNPGGTTTVPIATTAFAGSDPEDGTYSAGLSGRQVALSPATNGTLFYNGSPVSASTIITNFNPALVTLDPIDGAITASFAYTIFDNALVSAPSATTVNLPFSLLTISGTIFDDANGLTDGVISGTATNAGGSLYVIVSNAANNNVVASTLVPATGVYSLTGLYPASYNLSLSTTPVAVGATAPAVSLPANFTSIGEGTAAGGDGTPNGITSVTLITTSVAGVNFGIDQRPSSVSAVTLASQPNPGGTTTVPIATTAFAGSDPEDGTYSAGLSGRQVALSPATNGTLFYNGSPVSASTIITNFTPALVTLDPIDGAITASFAYTIFDNALVSAPSATTVNLPFSLLTISGTIFDDANGLTDGVISGTATNAGGSLYVIVSNAANNNVVASTLVPATGVYSLTGLYPASYSVRLSTTSAAVGATAPAVSLPANFTSIGEGTVAGGDGTPNGITSVTLTTASVAGVNFGIDQRPSSVSAVTLASQPNPGGTTTVPVATTAFAGSDPEDGTYAAGLSGRQVALSPATNGILYYNGTAVTSTTIITGFNPALVTLDPIDGAITASFAYTIFDNALVSAPSATTVNLPFSLLTISGTIFDDANGLTDGVISGTATNAGGSLYVIVSNAANNNVVASTLVPATGVYSLTGLYPASYNLSLSTTPVAVGATAPAVSLPANFTSIGEGTVAGGDGTPNGITSVTLTTASVAGVNFGIDQRPSSVSAVTLASQPNPGGTTTVPIGTTAFAGSDPEDGTYSAGLSGRQVALSPATNGTLFYNGSPVSASTIITNFNPALVTLAPIDGAITASFAYTIFDNALVSAPSATTVNLPFSLLTISGTIFDDANGLTDGVISGTATNAGGSLYVIVSNAANNNVVASTLVPATGVYSLTGLYPASYSVRLSTTSVAVGATTPAVSLPPNFTSIGEGTAAGGDGTPNGITSVTLTTASVAGVNFGIDQRPSSVSAVTLASQPNPGGTTTVPVATTAFAGSDPEDGTYAAGLSGRQVALSPATNGILYYNGTAVTSTTIITGFNPALVTLDPIDGAITASFAYTIFDNALVSAPSATTVNLPFSLLTISGTIFDDANGLTDGVISGTATNAGGSLYVIVSEATSGTVVTSTLVPATGVYSLTGLYPASYSVRLSTTNVAVGAQAPAVSLPANFTSIGEGTAAGGDGTPNGITSVTLTTASVAGVNFGIDQRPSSVSAVTLASQPNPGGTATVPVATTAFAGSDPEDGTYAAGLAGRQVALSPATNGTLFYNGSPVSASTIITNFTPALVTLDPVDGAITASFAYTIFDNALVSAPSATTVNLPFTLLTISGTIFDDANGLTDGVISGTATNAGGNLYVIVSNTANNTVVTSTLVPATGVYSLTGLYPASYNLSLSTTSVAVGATAPAVSLPANFTSIGEGTAAGGDGTPNGITSVTLTTASVAGVNFGLDQLPIPTSVTLTAQANPGGTNSIIVPSTIPNGTDADGIVGRVLYTAFPANATSISIGGTVYTAATFPPAGVTVTVGTTLLVDPVDGLVTVSVPFRVIDNALQPSLAIGLITIPFTCPTPLCPVVTGQRINRI